jgi:hypothetical protein
VLIGFPHLSTSHIQRDVIPNINTQSPAPSTINLLSSECSECENTQTRMSVYLALIAKQETFLLNNQHKLIAEISIQ